MSLGRGKVVVGWNDRGRLHGRYEPPLVYKKINKSLRIEERFLSVRVCRNEKD